MSWGEPIDVELDGSGKCRNIATTADAAECLIEEWPHEARGDEYWRAVESCLADLRGEPTNVRECFFAAANAAKIPIRLLNSQ